MVTNGEERGNEYLETFGRVRITERYNMYSNAKLPQLYLAEKRQLFKEKTGKKFRLIFCDLD